jgi:hypothetical protein
MIGLSCMSDIFRRTSEERGWDRSVSFANVTLQDASNDVARARIETMNQWHELSKLLEEPFRSITETIDEGFEHVIRVLQLKKAPLTPSHDQEAGNDKTSPGTPAFAESFRARMEKFQQSKQLMLRGWCDIHGIKLPPDFFSSPTSKDFEAPFWMSAGPLTGDRRRLRRQLMVSL